MASRYASYVGQAEHLAKRLTSLETRCVSPPTPVPTAPVSAPDSPQLPPVMPVPAAPSR
jgi:hypothetical protein